MKKLIVFILLFSVFLPVSASTHTFPRTTDNLLVSEGVLTPYNQDDILATPAVDASEKVYDFAELLSDSEEDTIYKEITKYIDTTNMDFVVVTISENNKNSAQSYADDFYDYNDFGIGSSNNGVLFLVDMDTREIYISTTGQAIDYYSDYRINSCLDNIYLEFSNGNYYEGVLGTINTLENYFELGLPSNKDSNYEILNDGEVVRKFPYFLVFGIPFIITVIVIKIMVSKNKLVRKATSSREYLVKDSVHIKTIHDRLVSTHTTVTPIYQSNSSGGSGGGSSTHRGSSGRSHGGGGHRF